MGKHNRKRKGSGVRVLLGILCTILGILLAVMVGATAYVTHLYNQMNYQDPSIQETISQEELDQLMREEEEPDPAAPTLDPNAQVDTDHNTQIGGAGSDIVNILLIGQDRRPGEGRARSDAMILCTFHKNTGKLTMTSFLRDLYVAIPGYRNNRINAAYSAGGMPLLNETLELNFGVHVDGNIEVDFTQFAQVIDLLGGVEIELRQDEANVINKVSGRGLSAGTALLTGQEALTYARIRKLDSDFGRTERQRKVLNSLIRKFKNSDLNTLLKLLDEVLPLVTTDMTQAEIVSLATQVFPKLRDLEISSQRIPADDAFRYATISGMSVVEADMDAARKLLEDTLK